MLAQRATNAAMQQNVGSKAKAKKHNFCSQQSRPQTIIYFICGWELAIGNSFCGRQNSSQNNETFRQNYIGTRHAGRPLQKTAKRDKKMPKTSHIDLLMYIILSTVLNYVLYYTRYYTILGPTLY